MQRIDVIAAEAQEGGPYLLECSVCGPLSIQPADDVDDECREHLKGHGVTKFFTEEKNDGPD